MLRLSGTHLPAIILLTRFWLSFFSARALSGWIQIETTLFQERCVINMRGCVEFQQQRDVRDSLLINHLSNFRYRLLADRRLHGFLHWAGGDPCRCSRKPVEPSQSQISPQTKTGDERGRDIRKTRREPWPVHTLCGHLQIPPQEKATETGASGILSG